MATFQLTSPAFRHGDTIPVKFTCDGEDVSPELNWTGVPSGTKAFALICDDPDAPMGTWAHWVLFNLPPELNSLPENFTASKAERHGAERPGFFVNGINDFRRLGYGGPCPPKGPTHRYFFKLYALDQPLGLKSGASKADVEQAMKGHVLAMAELMGKYKR